MLLYQQLAPYDEYLSRLILTLSFDEARTLPNMAVLRKLTGLRETHQRHLVASMVESEMLQADDSQDVPVRYTLCEDFEWSSRFRLFVKAFQTWNQAMANTYATTPLTFWNAQTSSIMVSKAPTQGFPITSAINPEPAVRLSTSNTEASTTKETTSTFDHQRRDMVSASTTTSATLNIMSTAAHINGPDDIPLTTMSDLMQDFGALLNRIDKFYLNFAKILDSTHKFRHKSVDVFATALSETCSEMPWFIVLVLKGKFQDVPNLFTVTFSPSCKVDVNKDVDLDIYPLTYRFIKDRISAKQGFFYKTWNKLNELNKFQNQLVGNTFDEWPRSERSKNMMQLTVEHADDIYATIINLVNR